MWISHFWNNISSHLTRTWLEFSYRPVISYSTEVCSARYLSWIKASSYHRCQTKTVEAESRIQNLWRAPSHNQVTEMLHLKTIRVGLILLLCRCAKHHQHQKSSTGPFCSWMWTGDKSYQHFQSSSPALQVPKAIDLSCLIPVRKVQVLVLATSICHLHANSYPQQRDPSSSKD